MKIRIPLQVRNIGYNALRGLDEKHEIQTTITKLVEFVTNTGKGNKKLD